MILNTPSLLITDDDRDFRETLRGVFEPRGFRTLLAADGAEALEIVARDDVHLLLLDMHMPKLNGLETIQRVKQIRAELPCILISGGLDELLRAAARQADAFSVLSKPISLPEVTGAVRDALQQHYRWELS